MLAANPQIKDGNLIYPGQVITIPVVRTTTPSLTTPFYYTVQSGDTLTSIGRKFEMDPSVVAYANGITDGIAVLGKIYLIPAGPHQHFVLAGETLRVIAEQYGTTVTFLLTGNNLPNPDLIYVGQPIFIPIIFDARPVPLTGGGTPAPTGTPGPSPTPNPPTATPGPTATRTPVPTPATGDFIVVTVRSGESLLTYVYRYGVTGSSIRAVNPQLTDPNIIFPGDLMVIPVPVSFTPSRTTPFFYVVVAGDTTASIAGKFEVDLEVLTAHNPGANFAVGSTILLPAGPHLYTVIAGDDLKGIAAKYGTTVDFLLTGNNLPNPDLIFPGQQIFIPTQYNAVPKGYN
jgi:LysM repeat protein